jgi:hypothetical protein
MKIGRFGLVYIYVTTLDEDEDRDGPQNVFLTFLPLDPTGSPRELYYT